ncbi:unnamed protein product, partial [Oppiella nova]
MDILIHPVFSPCCRHSYCNDCIREWLKTNNTCPNDRAQLRDTDLIQQSRAFVNLLDNLRLNCDFSGKGCDTTVRLSDLGQHVKHCPYNPFNKCRDCEQPVDKQHNCVHNLRQQLKLLTDEMNRLRASKSAIHVTPVMAPSGNSALRINSCELPVDIQEVVIKITKRLEQECTSQRELAVQLKQELDKNYGTDWTCMIREPGRAAIAFYC